MHRVGHAEMETETGRDRDRQILGHAKMETERDRQRHVEADTGRIKKHEEADTGRGRDMKR